MKKIAALVALAGIAAVANAQPGTANTIVYAARANSGDSWHVGGLSLSALPGNSINFEVGIFLFRAQGVGHATAVTKAYIDGVTTGFDSVTIIEDPSNGTPGTSGVDGRVGVFNSGAQVQKVFTQRSAGLGGPGYRISSAADATDGSAAGGISIKQQGPVGNGNFQQGDGLLGYRFDVTLAGRVAGSLVTAPVLSFASRLGSYSTYNDIASNTTTENKATTTIEGVTLVGSWIPAPSSLALLGLGGLIAGRRRR